MPSHWQEETWCPLQLGKRWDELKLAPRHCPACLRYGYHCALFQMPFLERCPWHGIALRDGCVHCGRRYPVQFALHAHLGRCACGHDPFDVRVAATEMHSFPTERAASVLESYLQWCRGERAQRRLVAPRTERAWWPALASLAAPPATTVPGLRADLPDLHRWTARGHALPEPPARAFWPWVIIGARQPLTISPLPARLHRPLMRITQAAAAPLAPTVRTPPDFEDLYGLELSRPLAENLRTKPQCFILPFGRKLEGGAWLHLTAVP